MRISLQQMFESHKDVLSLKLDGLHLPSDENRVFKIVYDYLNSVFDTDGEFRQSLTQSEDYILQAAISLLNAQKEMSESIKAPEINDTEEEHSSHFDKFTKTSSEASLIGAGVGAVAGKLVLGGWGAVFGALAGTAIAIYVASLKNSQPSIL